MLLRSKSSRCAARPPEVQVVGPFLGYRGPGAIRVCIGLPHRSERTLICCVTDGAGRTVSECLGETLFPTSNGDSGGRYRTFVFDFSGLPSGELLSYTFLLEARVPLELQGGLQPDDCRFRVPGNLTDQSSVVLLSCHNPFVYSRGAAKEGWTMWQALLTTIDRDPGIELLILGGDQVYNDDLEEEGFIRRLCRKPDDRRLHEKIRRRLIRQYQIFWGNPSYRRVLARIPSVAMWDDHDITDGWGGRAESFRMNGDALPGWQRYYELCREAFVAYQGVRNPSQPPAFAALTRPIFTTAFELGDCRFLLLDLRSEKNFLRRQVVSAEHAAAVHACIADTPNSIKRLFVLTPVVPLRTNFDEDTRLSLFAQRWRDLQLRLGRYPSLAFTIKCVAFAGWIAPLVVFLGGADGSLWRNALALLAAALLTLLWLAAAGLHWAEHFTLLPQLTDDLEDGLSTDANRPTLVALLESLAAVARRTGVAPILLSGDIHTAGITEILHRQGEDIVSIPQIVASPISSEPMPKAVEGFTTTTSEMELEKSKTSRLWARNIVYISKRNFAVFRLKRAADRRPVEFHLEEHELPVAFNLDFRPGNTPANPEPGSRPRPPVT